MLYSIQRITRAFRRTFGCEVGILNRVSGLLAASHGGYIALISVLVVGAVGGGITISLILLGLGSARTSLSVDQSNQAMALSNACAEEALQRIRDSATFTGNRSLTLGEGVCEFTVTSQGGQNRTVTASGVIGNNIRKEKIKIDKINPAIQVVSWEEIADL